MAPAAVRGQCDVITVDTDQRVADANMSLTPGGIIRGRVLDKDGQPLEGGLVKAEVDQPLQGANTATTGADGRFEITSVPPGQMLIRVDPPAGPPALHRTMYYPGVPTSRRGATGHHRDGRNRGDRTPPARHTGGHDSRELSGPEGFRVQKMTLVNPDTRMLINMKVSDEGVASVTDLDEGRYAIAVTAAAGSDTLAAHQLIIVGAGDYDVPMQLEPTATVAGRVVVDRGGVPPVDGVTVEAHWVSDNLKLDLTGPERISVAPDGSFTMRGLYGRRQFHVFGLSDEWRVTAVRAGRSDVTSGLDLAPGSATEISIVVGEAVSAAWLIPARRRGRRRHTACRIRTGATCQVSGTATVEPRDIVDSRTRGRCAVGRTDRTVRKSCWSTARSNRKRRRLPDARSRRGKSCGWARH